MPVLAVEGEDVGGEEDDEPLTEKSSLNQKTEVMRKKLKLARELLEDLLVERDEMEQIQAEELDELDERCAAGEEEAEALRQEIMEVRAMLEAQLAGGADKDDEGERELLAAQKELDELREEIVDEEAANPAGCSGTHRGPG